MNSSSFRYSLPKKAVKADCPACGPKYRKTLSRYIDTKTGELLPAEYGRCDRESNCGYHLNPYHKGPSGLSYYEEIKARTSIGPIPKTWFTLAARQKHQGASKQDIITSLVREEGATLDQAERVATFLFDQPDTRLNVPHTATSSDQVCTIPTEVLAQSLTHYERNQFAFLLRRHFGVDVADDLLKRFYIGTASRWPGACVFWYIDEEQRIRAAN